MYNPQMACYSCGKDAQTIARDNITRSGICGTSPVVSKPALTFVSVTALSLACIQIEGKFTFKLSTKFLLVFASSKTIVCLDH